MRKDAEANTIWKPSCAQKDLEHREHPVILGKGDSEQNRYKTTTGPNVPSYTPTYGTSRGVAMSQAMISAAMKVSWLGAIDSGCVRVSRRVLLVVKLSTCLPH